MLNEHLRRAEQQVADDAARIAQQRTLVAELARAGYSTAQARVLLAQFEELQEVHLAERDQLRWQLGLWSPHR
jgi:hypothetical protein